MKDLTCVIIVAFLAIRAVRVWKGGMCYLGGSKFPRTVSFQQMSEDLVAHMEALRMRWSLKYILAL